MAHIRTQIRAQMKSILEAALPSVGYEVRASRKTMYNHDPNKALVDMRFQVDQVRLPETMTSSGGDRERISVASLYIRVQRSAAEEDLDDLLDADSVLIIKAIDAHEDWEDLLEEQPELSQTLFSDAEDAGYTIGSIVLRYDLEYRVHMSDPETVSQ